jgi:(E)-4-hydroxy-3-methylbut-2-enyl-diphosphate synthase
MSNVRVTEPRRKTRAVRYGTVIVGGDAPVSIQSMCTCPASELERALAEIAALAKAGCQIVRVALRGAGDLEALPDLCRRSPIPVVADVHFDYRLAVAAAGAGAAGLRINPGNIGGSARVRAVVEAAGAAGIPVRVGVNAGSIEKDLRGRYASDPAGALAESALRSLVMMEGMGFGDLVFSLKSSDPAATVEANMIFASRCDYPLHVGVTEAGPPLSGAARSVVALTRLFTAGVGDTVRVSLSGDPVDEVIVSSAMLTALGLRDDFPRIISCPTCGRCHIDVAGIAGRLEREINGCGAPVRIAVMGCEVNGPGEAADADAGIAGSPRGPVLFRRGEIVGPVGGDPLEALLDEIARLTGGESPRPGAPETI